MFYGCSVSLGKIFFPVIFASGLIHVVISQPGEQQGRLLLSQSDFYFLTYHNTKIARGSKTENINNRLYSKKWKKKKTNVKWGPKREVNVWVYVVWIEARIRESISIIK